jgi:hypothetical protein
MLTSLRGSELPFDPVMQRGKSDFITLPIVVGTAPRLTKHDLLAMVFRDGLT